jgi:V/A-type H+-transporting ATPase subunit I
MLLRPANATWFELLTGREEMASILRCLAATGEVELESHGDVSAAHLMPALRSVVEEYRHLAQRYATYWPPAATNRAERRGGLEEVASAALVQLRAWAAAADPLIVRLQQLSHERSGLELL